MKLVAALLYLTFVASFVDARYSSPEDFDDWQLSSDEELQVEERFIGSALAAAKKVSSTATDAVQSVVSTSVNAGVSAANTAKNASVAAASAIKNVSLTAAQTGVNLVQQVSDLSMSAGIDLLLFSMKTFMKATGKENIVLPKIETKFSGVSFNTSEGYFRTLHNLTRSGNANVSTSGLSLVITFPLTLTGLEVGYPNYTAKAFFITSTGNFEVNIEKNTIEVSIRLTPGLSCQINVDKVEITELEGITVEFNGLCDLCNTVVEKASAALATYLKKMIITKVQSCINDAIENALENNPMICAEFIGSGAS